MESIVSGGDLLGYKAWILQGRLMGREWFGQLELLWGSVWSWDLLSTSQLGIAQLRLWLHSLQLAHFLGTARLRRRSKLQAAVQLCTLRPLWRIEIVSGFEGTQPQTTKRTGCGLKLNAFFIKPFWIQADSFGDILTWPYFSVPEGLGVLPSNHSLRLSPWTPTNPSVSPRLVNYVHFHVPWMQKLSEILASRGTAPFPFCGNRFEFRAVGSSQNCCFPVMVCNAIMSAGPCCAGCMFVAMFSYNLACRCIYDHLCRCGNANDAVEFNFAVNLRM